jgi:CheY-like chemotaxis protein
MIEECIPPTRQLRILVVDDLLLDLFFMKTVLLTRIKGITLKEILTAEDGKEALRVHQESEKIDLIFMNIMMPVMDGFEATRQIRRTDREVKIIAWTEYPYDSIAEKLRESGFDGYLKKPVSSDSLQNVIDGFIQIGTGKHQNLT